MLANVFKRYERKYKLTAESYTNFKELISNYVVLDVYGEYTIYNIYYDTQEYDLIRKSIEKPIFKEKLRLRSYMEANDRTEVFIELKKKYKGIVYKRRSQLEYAQAKEFLIDAKMRRNTSSQVLKEIDSFLSTYKVSEKVLIYYNRAEYIGMKEKGLRITFDNNLRFREANFELKKDETDSEIIPNNEVIMEIKTNDSFPLWLCQILSKEKIYPISFSKYGTCYKNYIFQRLLKERGTHEKLSN
ncbi:MAG: polyphosphate polymerase domain-containing protein [Christensenellaceae bacterium]|jgi:SPX domain protein involved in polyphosphate accumulation|nr:polyphosphate polymerase domain-containing protein [Christensenellaceae bacterium]